MNLMETLLWSFQVVNLIQCPRLKYVKKVDYNRPIKSGVIEADFYSDCECKKNLVGSDGLLLNKCIAVNTYPDDPVHIIIYANKTDGFYNVGYRRYSDSACKKFIEDVKNDPGHLPTTCTKSGHFYFKASNPSKFRSSFPMPGINYLTYADCAGCHKASTKTALAYHYYPFGVCDYGSDSVVTQCSKEKYTYNQYAADTSCTGKFTAATVPFATTTCIEPPVPGYIQTTYACV